VRLRDALAIVRRRENLRRTIRIALVVGCVLTTINQLDILVHGRETSLTWAKIPLNFCVPFVVSNLGVLTGTRSARTPRRADVSP
jgi:hypothetical protein